MQKKNGNIVHPIKHLRYQANVARLLIFCSFMKKWQTNIEGTCLGMEHCYNLAFRSQPLSNLFRPPRGVGWYKFACGFVGHVRKKQHTGDRSSGTIDH